jgi:hypothetical protein
MAGSASGRRRPWAAALGFICCRGGGEARGRLRRPQERKLRTVPVSVPAVGSAEDDQGVRRGEDAAGKVSLLRTFCCFLPPARTPRRKGSSAQQKQQERMPAPAPGPRNGDDDPPTEASPARRVVIPSAAAEIDVAAATTTTTPRDAGTNGGSSGEALSVAARSGGSREAAYFQGEFGPAAGLCVVAATSVAGLLGGRLLAVVACLCAWLFVLWIRRRRRLAASTGSKSKGSEQR